MIRVLLAEDQGMMRGALALLLDMEPDIEVVSQVGTGDEVVASAVEAAAIRRVLGGEQVIDPGLAAAALRSGSNPLTTREREVLAAGLDGSTIGDIASRLHLSESTVGNYLSAAIGKVGARNRIEAAQTARDNGWL